MNRHPYAGAGYSCGCLVARLSRAGSSPGWGLCIVCLFLLLYCTLFLLAVPAILAAYTHNEPCQSPRQTAVKTFSADSKSWRTCASHFSRSRTIQSCRHGQGKFQAEGEDLQAQAGFPPDRFH